MPFIDSLDIANRSCQHLGVTRIASPDEDSNNNAEITFAYDKMRRQELTRRTWTFATKTAVIRPIDTTTFKIVPALWNAGVQYLPGSLCSDANGQLWVSNQANNIGNDPNLTDVWDGYFGSMTADAYDTTGETAYYAGDIVYIQNSDSSYTLYLSLQNGNTETPNVADAWSATNTYQEDDLITYGGVVWRSLISLNTNNIPSQGPANWNTSTSYLTSNTVTGSDGFIYTAAQASSGVNPVSDNGTYWTNTDVPNAWTSQPAMPVCSSLWTPLYAALQSFNFVYPIGVGPLSQQITNNIFHLPAGYLRQCSQNPKAGQFSFLGAPVYNQANDWQIQGDYLTSSQGTPLFIRFIADIMSVKLMEDLFCEMLAARIALSVCERLTNSKTLKQTINNDYKEFGGEALIIGSIETGATEPDEDSYIMCRL
jgi:hypothetical protein